MKAADIPELPVLQFIEQHGGIGCNWFGSQYERSVTRAMPKDTPPKVALAKMKALIRKGLVDGCACGCRGDFELTDKGRAQVEQENGGYCAVCGVRIWFVDGKWIHSCHHRAIGHAPILSQLIGR